MYIHLSLSLPLVYLFIYLSIYRSIYLSIYIYLYRYVVVLFFGAKSGHSGVIIWAKFVFKTMFVKNIIQHRGFSTKTTSGVIIWAKLAILCCKKLGPHDNPYLAQTIAPEHGIVFCFPFFAFEIVLKYLLYIFFWTSTKFCPKLAQWTKNTLNSHILKKQRLYRPKKRFVATPNFTKHWCFTTCPFWNIKALMLNKDIT